MPSNVLSSTTTALESLSLSCASKPACALTRTPNRSFSASTAAYKQKILTRAQQRRRQDKYMLAQHQARIAANRSRQQVLRRERAAAAGDPVKGITTPFVQSFDTAQDPALRTDAEGVEQQGGRAEVVFGRFVRTAPVKRLLEAHEAALVEVEKGQVNARHEEQIKELRTVLVELKTAGAQAESHTRMSELGIAHALNIQKVADRLKKSFEQTRPLDQATREATEAFRGPATMASHGKQTAANIATSKAERIEDALYQIHLEQQHILRHRNAALVLARVTDLASESAAGRRKVNIQRCVEEFGRHKTDQKLAPKPLGLPAMARDEKYPDKWVQERTTEATAHREAVGGQQRGGPDTGSSEVQIAILTAKIRALGAALEQTGRTDKVGKRNLRLLVHRRQKHLKYLWRKERGGPRWQHCIEKLGLTEGTWKGEISL